MALTGTDRGTGNNGTTGLTLAVVPASNLAAGSMAVLVVAADNTGASGIYSITTCTDTKGNTWVRQQSPLYDPGLAAAGVQGAIFTTKQNGGALTTGDTITVTFSVTTVAKAWTLMEIVPAAGKVVAYFGGGVNAGAATAAPTVTTVSITSGDMVVGALFNEYGTAQTVTGDADSTNGTWSSQQTNEVGTTAAGISVSSQRKVTTGTATQTYNPTLGTSSDVILAYAIFRELTITAGYADTVVADGAVHYWRLGEASGNPQDSIGTSHVDAVGGTPNYSVAGALPGDANTAVTLVRASSEYFRVPDSAALDLGDGPWSFEFWFKRASLGTFQAVFDHGGSSGSGPVVYFSTSNGFGVAPSSSGSYSYSFASFTDTADWHHCVLTKNGAAATGYIDGVAAGGITTPFTYLNGSGPLYIGWDAGSSYFDGSLDDLAFYNVVLTANQVAIHYASASLQTIALGLIDAGSAIYAPTVAAGSSTQAIGALALLDGTSAIYAPTLTLKNTLTVGLLDGVSAIYSPTLTPKNTLTVGLIDAGSAIYAPTVVPGAVTAALGLIDSGSAIYSPTVSPQAVTTGALPLLDGANAVYAPTLTTLNAIDLALLDAGAAIYAPALTPKNTIGALPLLGGVGYSDLVVADGAIHYWRFGEPSGNPQDSIGTSHVDAVGGTPDYGIAGPLIGDADTAVHLTRASSEYFRVPDSAALDLGDVFTIEAWVKRDSLGNYHVIYDHGGSSGSGPLLFFFPSNGWGFAPSSSGTLVASGGFIDDTTTWHHLVATKDGAAVGIYQDGFDVTVANTPATILNGSGPLYIGTDNGTSLFDGSIDELAVYPTALTPLQVLAHYSAASGASIIYPLTLTVGAVTLTLDLIDAGSAIYALTLIPQPVTVGALPLLDGESALYAPSVLQAQSIGDLAFLDGANAVYAPTLAPQPVTGTLPLIDAGSAIYALTVLPGAVTITLTLTDAAAAIYAPTLTTGAVTVGALDLLDSGSAIYDPTLVGTNTITLGSSLFDPDIFDPDIFDTSGVLDGGRAIYALTVIPGAATITLTLTDAGPAIYDPTLTTGAVTVELDLLDAGPAIYAPAVQPAQFLDLDLLDGASAIFAPTVIPGAASTALPLVDGSNAIFALTLTPTNAIVLGLTDAGSAIYAPTLLPTNTLSLDLIDAGPAIYDPLLTPVNALSLDLIDSGSLIFTPTLTTGAVTIELDLVDAEAAIFDPVLTTGAVDITLELNDSPSAIYAPSVLVGTVYVELPLLDGESATYAPEIHQAQFVVLDPIESASAIYDPTVIPGAADAALPLIDSGALIFALTLAPTNTLTLVLLDAGSAIYDPTLAPTNSLVLAILDGGRAIYAPTLEQISTAQDLTLGLLDGLPAVYAPLLLTKNDITLAALDGGNAIYDPTLLPQPVTVTLPTLDALRAIYALSLPGDPFGRHVHGLLWMNGKPRGALAVLSHEAALTVRANRAGYVVVDPSPEAGVTVEDKPEAEVLT